MIEVIVIEKFQAGAYEFEVLDMDRQRIDKVMIRQLPELAGVEAEEAGDD